MVKIQIFISHKYEDNKYYNGMAGLLTNPNNICMHSVIRERDDLRDKGENVVKTHLKKKIRNCYAVICLIGQDTHSSKWVQWELEVATSLKKKIIPVRIKDTTGNAPKIIRERKISTLPWSVKKINKILKIK